MTSRSQKYIVVVFYFLFSVAPDALFLRKSKGTFFLLKITTAVSLNFNFNTRIPKSLSIQVAIYFISAVCMLIMNFCIMVDLTLTINSAVEFTSQRFTYFGPRHAFLSTFRTKGRYYIFISLLKNKQIIFV